MRLFEIANELRTIADNCDPDTGALTDEQVEAMTALEISAETKMRGLIGIIKEQRAEGEMIAAEGKRLTELSRVRLQRAERLTEYLTFWMDQLGIRKQTCDIGEASIVKNPPSFDVNEAESIPDEFVRVTTSPDKAKAKDHWKATGIVPTGFVLVTDKTSLRIK